MTRQRTHYREFNVSSGESDTPEFSVETHQDRTEVRLREQEGQTQAIFSVLDADGDVLFEVTPDGVEFDVSIGDDSIAGTKLADAVAGSGLSKDGSENLQVNVDGSTIEIATDTLRVKDLGVSTAKLANDAVTYAKIQNVTTDRLIGRDTAGSGDPEELTVGGGIEFTGSAGIQRSALTGAVTASAGSGTTALANDAVTTSKILDDAVTYAKMQNVSGPAVIGRAAGTAGDLAAITASNDGDVLTRVAGALAFAAPAGGGGGGAVVDVQSFTSSGTWTKPSDGQTMAEIIVIGGGGGGGSGININDVDLSGGAGGGGGGCSRLLIPLAALGSTETVTIPAAAAGGAGAVSGFNGNAGAAGGAVTFGAWCRATGGAGGAGGGQNTTPAGGVGGKGSFADGGVGATGSLRNGGAGAAGVGFSAGSGGGGGGSTSNAGSGVGGGAGGIAGLSARAGGVGGAVASTGSAPAADSGATEAAGGPGGGGGGGPTGGGTSGGAGGAGGEYGGGGGGSGSSAGGTGRAGGDGAKGYVQVICW